MTGSPPDGAFSCIETGRAQPSRRMLLHLAAQLDIPLRERNRLLLAAGYAPVYQKTSLAGPAMWPARAAIDRLLRAHELVELEREVRGYPAPDRHEVPDSDPKAQCPPWSV